MRSFKDLSGQEAVSHALSLFSRSVLMAGNPAFVRLSAMLSHALRGALPDACRSYHDALAAMLSSPALRASGDLWKDEVLRCVILEEHPFALMAASGRRDPAQFAAMGEELEALSGLFSLSSQDILAILKDRSHQKPGRDGISMMSQAVWSGTGPKAMPRGEEPMQPSMPLALAPFEYGRGCLEGGLAAQEAIEELYMRFLESGDWPGLTEDLYTFFASYGTGPFLRDRAFRVSGGRLAPLPASAAAPLEPVSLYEEQHMALMDNTIAFMRGERSRHMALWGESGLGKTAHVASLLHELPEVRLILASRCDMEGLADVLDRLSGQPLRFILLLDGVEDGPELRAFAARTLGFRALPENLLIYATCREQPADMGPFQGALGFRYPTLHQFSTLITELMECRGAHADRQAVHNAAVDHQVDVREKLTFQGARAIAERLARG